MKCFKNYILASLGNLAGPAPKLRADCELPIVTGLCISL